MRAFKSLGICLVSLTVSASASAAGKTLGFAVTKWNTAMHATEFMDECPEGLNPGNLEVFMSKMPIEERRKLPIKVATELREANFRGKNGEDICVSPTSTVDPPLKVVEGKYSYGLDLDGNADGSPTPKTCKHQNFTGLDGTIGVDNQMYRLFGCVNAWRPKGHIENNANAHRLSSGLGMILMEVTDIDDMKNDDDVKVSFYRGIDPFTLDSTGKALPFSSYDIDTENGRARYGQTVKGKIKDGVLTTETADVDLPFFGNYQFMTQSIREMQLRMEFLPDGSGVKGLVGGYYSVDQIYSYVRGMLGAFPNTHHFTCPSIYVAAHELADGHPDQSGACTTLSSAFHFEAVAAFINHPPQQTASER